MSVQAGFPPLEPAAEIGLDHLRMGADLRRRAVGEPLAVVEHRDAVAGRHHHIHVMLDQEDCRAALANGPDQVDKTPAFNPVQACCRLIKQQ